MSIIWIEAPRTKKTTGDVLFVVRSGEERTEDIPWRPWLGEELTRVRVDNTDPNQALVEIYRSDTTLLSIARALLGTYSDPPETFDILPGEIIRLSGGLIAVKTKPR